MKMKRLREIRADCLASALCGYNSFARSLKTSCVMGDAYANEFHDNLVEDIKAGKRKDNIYSEFRAYTNTIPDLLLKKEKMFMSEKDDPDAIHPALKERLRYAPRAAEHYSDHWSSLSLFSDHEKYEQKLTFQYMKLLKIVLSSKQP